MPLPPDDVPWPPRTVHRALRRYAEHAAWYKGDPAELGRVYGDQAGALPGLDLKGYDRPSQYRGGLVGRMARMFWGNPLPINDLRSSKLHIPLAADIATTSSDLLYSEPLEVKTENDATTKRLNELFELALHAVLSESGEFGSAWGGVYLRGAYDVDVADHPLPEAVTPDTAVPEWRWGQLVAVTFWECVYDDGRGKVWRHLERHEPGRVWHGLYEGTKDRLGKRQPLEAHTSTAGLAKLVDEEGGMATGATRLAVEYLPNVRPNRDAELRPLGRSDFDGVEPVMDQLDECWTSWMRDLRLGKGRLVVPDAYMQGMGTGRGAWFDPDREIYSALKMMPGESPAQALKAVQFEIRVQEHADTAKALTAQAIRDAGYSASTFADADSSGGAATATEIRERQRRTLTTRGKKILYQRERVRRFCRTLLEIDQHVFGTGVTPQLPDLHWPDAVAPDPEATARTVQLIAAAEAASIETRVRLLNPDWDDPQVQAEVQRIKDEQGGGGDPAVDLDRYARGDGKDDEDQADDDQADDEDGQAEKGK